MRNIARQRGFTLLELVVVIIIISGLLYIGMDRLARLEVRAEQAAMEQVIGSLKSALALTMSRQVARADIAGLQRYLGTNPMDLLAETPHNYLGSFPCGPARQPPGAHWFYDRSDRSLVYVSGNPGFFFSEGEEKSVTRLKIMPVYDDNNANGRFDAGDTLAGLKLAATAPYHWRTEPMNLSADTMRRQ